MNRSIDPLFDHRIAAWLEEDPNRAPDQALETVLAAVPSIAQRRRLPVPRRYNAMSLPLRLAAATLIAAVLVGGGIYLLGPRATGPGAEASSSLVPDRPSAAPLTDGLLVPGLYAYEGDRVRVTVAVPPGWEGGAFSVSHAPGRELPDGANLGFRQPTVVFSDPCDAGPLSAKPVGPTVMDLANALAGLPHLTDATQQDVTISGFGGTHLTFVVETKGIDCVMALYRQIDFVRAADDGQHQDLWILDVAGTRLVVDAATYPETSPDVRAELQTMVDALVIESTE